MFVDFLYELRKRKVKVGAHEAVSLARAMGALFIRSYERGERVHLAMLSRGYDGRLPSQGRS